MTDDPRSVPSNLMTDRELLISCLNAMRVAQLQTAPTDWRHMIQAIKQQISEPPAPETADESPIVEVWHGTKKVTVYRDTVIWVWGPHIENDMRDEPRTLESMQRAFDWLYSSAQETSVKWPIPSQEWLDASQGLPPPKASAPLPTCQHDLLQPNTTIAVDPADAFHAWCTMCKHDFRTRAPLKDSGARCGNWPCQLPVDHIGPCVSSPENGKGDGNVP